MADVDTFVRWVNEELREARGRRANSMMYTPEFMESKQRVLELEIVQDYLTEFFAEMING